MFLTITALYKSTYLATYTYAVVRRIQIRQIGWPISGGLSYDVTLCGKVTVSRHTFVHDVISSPGKRCARHMNVVRNLPV